MSRTPDTVLAELLGLDYEGDALPNDPASNFAQMLAPLAAEISRFEGYAEEMLAEVNPGEAQYLLPDYERVLGPDPYGRDATALTLADQQALTLSRWVSRYGVRPADFIALAATFGVVITITEFVLSTVDTGVIGDTLVAPPLQYTWIVHMPAAALEYACAGSSEIGDPISSFQPGLVQPVIAGRAPAHTNPIFDYA